MLDFLSLIFLPRFVNIFLSTFLIFYLNSWEKKQQKKIKKLWPNNSIFFATIKNFTKKTFDFFFFHLIFHLTKLYVTQEQKCKQPQWYKWNQTKFVDRWWTNELDARFVCIFIGFCLVECCLENFQFSFSQL